MTIHHHHSRHHLGCHLLRSATANHAAGQRAPHVSGGREEGRGNLNVDPLKASRSRPDDRDKGKDPAVKDRERDRERCAFGDMGGVALRQHGEMLGKSRLN